MPPGFSAASRLSSSAPLSGRPARCGGPSTSGRGGRARPPAGHAALSWPARRARGSRRARRHPCAPSRSHGGRRRSAPSGSGAVELAATSSDGRPAAHAPAARERARSRSGRRTTRMRVVLEARVRHDVRADRVRRSSTPGSRQATRTARSPPGRSVGGCGRDREDGEAGDRVVRGRADESLPVARSRARADPRPRPRR